MHHVTIRVIVAMAALLAACADPVAPVPHTAGDPSSLGARRLPKPPVSPPDSVRVVPLPDPPIYVPLPRVVGDPE